MKFSNRELQNFKKKYFENTCINIWKYLDDECVEILKKMGITIEKNRLYTEYQYDMIEVDVLKYYYSEKDSSGEPKEKISDIGLSEKEYKKIVKVFDKIANDYNV